MTKPTIKISLTMDNEFFWGYRADYMDDGRVLTDSRRGFATKDAAQAAAEQWADLVLESPKDEVYDYH